MLHLYQFIFCHSAPGRKLNRCTGVPGDHQYPPAGFLVADIQMEIDNYPAAGFLTPVKFIIKLPIWHLAFLHQLMVYLFSVYHHETQYLPRDIFLTDQGA